MNFKKAVFLLILVWCINNIYGQNLTKDERIQWWREARFGMFIHFGVYSQWGGMYHGYKQARGGAEWIMNRCKIPVTEYQDTAKSFDPVLYNPDEIVKLAKQAGMKYIVITTKHHDGFALFKTSASKFNIIDAAKYGKDMLQPLAEACRKYNMKLGFYYSQNQDWNNPGGAVARKEMKEGWPNPDSAKIDAYTKAHDGHWDSLQMTKPYEQYINEVALPQVREILTNYGDIAIIWWDTPGEITDKQAQQFTDLLKLQPKIISNNRLKRPNFPGDFGTPEQKIPNAKELDGTDWESCMTMNGSWGYKSWDSSWKSAETLVQNLVDAASKGGNYILNIGPKPDGSLPVETTERLKAIGDWMKKNSEAIYATQAGPIVQPEWGRCTMKEATNTTTLYLEVFNIPSNGELIIPGVFNKIIKAAILNGQNVKAKTVNGNTIINIKSIGTKAFIPVVKLELQGKVKNVNKKSGNEMKSKELD